MSESERSLRVGLACGGTGGHIFPGLATARVLQERGHEVVLWMAGKDVEKEAVRDWRGEVLTVPAEGFPALFSMRTPQTLLKLVRASGTCKKLMAERNHDVVLAMGSYASVGPVMAALRLKVPVVLHEANVWPGKTISLFSRWATSVAASFEETRFYMKRKNLVVTGMPLRAELAKAVREHTEEGLDRNLFTILVMGGSRGAKVINELASDAICRVRAMGRELQVIHLAGLQDQEVLVEQYKKGGVHYKVHGFIQDMAPVYTSTDLAICRAGAATCAEISAFGVPSLLIPYPHAAHDHQTMNARALEKAGAADVVAEKDLEVDWLTDYIAGCLQTPGRLAKLSAAAKRRGMKGGAEALADVVEQAARSSS